MKKDVMFVSSGGGHLQELLTMKKLLEKYDSIVITEGTESSRSKCSDFDAKYLVYGTRNNKIVYLFKFLVNAVKSLFFTLKYRPQVVVTTGAHSAVSICFFAKLLGSKIIFVESMARVKTKSLTGKLLEKIVDDFYVQHECMEKIVNNSIYAGRLL